MTKRINVPLSPASIEAMFDFIEGQRTVLAGRLKAARIAIGEGVNVNENLDRISELLFELDATEDAWAELAESAPAELQRLIPEVDVRGVMDADTVTEQSTQRLFAIAEHFFSVLLGKPLVGADGAKKHRAAALRPVLERLHFQVKELMELNASTGIPISRLENQGIRSAVEQSLERIVRQDFQDDWRLASAFYETHRIQELPWETFVGRPSVH